MAPESKVQQKGTYSSQHPKRIKWVQKLHVYGKNPMLGPYKMESHQENYLFLLIVFCARDMIFCTLLDLLL